MPLLRSRTWDTRTAAAKAVGAIAENAPNYDPNSSRQLGHPNVDDPVPASNGSNGLHHDEQLNSATLNVSSILRHGKKLLGSAENGTDHALGALDSVERLEYLKKTLDGRLGLRG